VPIERPSCCIGEIDGLTIPRPQVVVGIGPSLGHGMSCWEYLAMGERTSQNPVVRQAEDTVVNTAARALGCVV